MFSLEISVYFLILKSTFIFVKNLLQTYSIWWWTQRFYFWGAKEKKKD